MKAINKQNQHLVDGTLKKIEELQKKLKLYSQADYTVGDKIVFRNQDYYIHEVKCFASFDEPTYIIGLPKNNGERSNKPKDQKLVKESDILPF